MPTPVRRERNTALYETILKIETVEECVQFFEDLCAITELSALEQRFDVARELIKGKVYSDILTATGASSATISRVNRMLRDGHGCLGEMLDRVEADKQKEE